MEEKAIKIKKPKREKKNISKKERIFKILWVIFLVILLVMAGIKALPSAIIKGNPTVMKAVSSIVVKLADDSVEYKNSKGETHKYFLKLDKSYFDKKAENKSSTPFLLEREEADGTRSVVSSKSDEILPDETFGNERIAVIIQFANTVTTKFGFDIYEEYYSGKSNDEVYHIGKGTKTFNNVFIFYIIFFIIFSILTYYQIWSRKYDEKLEREKEVQKLNEEYQKGLTREQASVSNKPKKLTKKQRRELNKKNNE